jgi:hypothetical protein
MLSKAKHLDAFLKTALISGPCEAIRIQIPRCALRQAQDKLEKNIKLTHYPQNPYLDKPHCRL